MNAAAEWLDIHVPEDTALYKIHTARLPWTSLSFRSHWILAAGLLPVVEHVSVIMSPSMAGLANPVISGCPGTPVLSEELKKKTFSHSGLKGWNIKCTEVHNKWDHHTISPRTVRKALVVLTGIVKREQVYWPSSDRLMLLIRMVSSCDDARTSSILWSLRAVSRRTQKWHRTNCMTRGFYSIYLELVWKQGIPRCAEALEQKGLP